MINIEKFDLKNDSRERPFSALKDLWNKCEKRYIFQTFEFQSIWWKYFGKRKEPLILLAREKDGNFVGLAPLMRDRSEIRFIGTPICDYMDFLYVKGSEEEVAKAFCEYIKKLKYSELDLRYMPEGSQALNFMKSEKIDVCPYINKEDDLNRIFHKYNYYEKKTSRYGKLDFGRIKEESEIDNFLDGYYKMHIKKWKRAEKYSQFQYQNWRDFARELCHALFQKEWLDLSFLKLNGDMIAAHLGFLHNGVFHYYMPTFDPDYSAYSIGNIFIKKLLENTNFNIFDFLRGDEAYKMVWTKKTKPLFNCYDYSVRGRFKKTGREFLMKQIRNMPFIMKLWYKTR